MRGRHMFLVAAALISLLVVPMTSAGTGTTGSPLKATWKGFVAYYVPDGCPPACKTFTTLSFANGHASGIGRISVKTQHRPYDLGNHKDGHITIVAANSDRLYGWYDYGAQGEGNTIPVTFTGGTGRFDGASGNAQLTYKVSMRFKPSPPCDKKTDAFQCLDADVLWPWSATMSGTINPRSWPRPE